MQTIKTAVVVVLLLGVCYGAYVALNAPEPTLPPELAEWNEKDMGSLEAGPIVDVPQLPPSAAPADLPPLAPPTITPPASTPPVAVTPPPPASTLAPPELPLDLEPKSSPENLSKLLQPSTSELPEGSSVPLPGLPDPKFPSDLPSLPGDSPSADSITQLTPPLTPPSSSDAGPSLPDLPSPGLLPPGTNSPSEGVAQGSLGPINDPKASKTALPYTVARQQALDLAKDGKLKAALEMMSPYFDHISLEEAEHKDLREMLDALAAEVIYSKRHLIENRFVVTPGESLGMIANKFHLSPETLASINRLDNPAVLLPGTELKVFHGPFRAEVDLSRGELVMYLGDMYAGLFPVTIGNTPKPELGSFTVVEKLRDKSYVTPKSDLFGPTDPRNPYGGYWMHLGKDICIHGSAAISDPALKDAGCISLAPLDAKDVYSMLGQGAEVIIRE